MANQENDQLVGLMTEMVAWLRFENRSALRSALGEILSTDNDRAIYELTDGARTQTAIAGEVGVSPRAVGYKWEAWSNAGVVFRPAGAKHLRHLASIESLGGLPE